MHIESRVEKLREYMESEDLEAVILMNPENQYYFTNFYAITYSRPIIAVVERNATHLIVPQLEEMHAKEEAKVNDIRTYYETPGKVGDAIILLKKLLEGSKRIGVEKRFLPLSLMESLGKDIIFHGIDSFVENMRMIKDDEELSLIVKAAKLADMGVEKSIEYARENVSELEIDNAGNFEILSQASKNYPEMRISLFSMSPSGSNRTAIPHVFSTGRKIKKGDVIIHSRQVSLNGYRAECERTFFLGPLKKYQEELLEIVTEAQKKAIEKIREGIRASEVDRIAREIIEEAGYGSYFPHRTGHGLGLSVHEPPYLRYDSTTILREGMVVTVEPGIYIPKMGGFRHSDTIIVKKYGAEVITKTPKDLGYLVR